MRFHFARPAALLLAGCALLFSACGKSPASAAGSPPPSFSSASSAAEVEWLNDRAKGYCSASGMYRAIQREDQLAQNIFYTDFASGQEIYLCSQPNCTHDSESCPAWLPLSGAITRVIPVGGKVVILYGGISSAQGESALPQVLLMDPDGGSRKTIARFEASDMVAAMPRGGLARDGQHLYFVLHSQTDSLRTLYAVDIAAEQVLPVCQLPGEEEKILGGIGQELLLSYTPGSYNMDNKAEDLTTQFVRLDPASGTVTPLFSRPYLEDFLGCAGGKAYLLDSAGTLRSFDLQTGALAAELQTDLPKEVLAGFPMPQMGIFEGKALLCRQLPLEDLENTEPLSSIAYCAVDLATGQSTRLPYTFFSEYGGELPCAVLGQDGTRFLLESGQTTISTAQPNSLSESSGAESGKFVKAESTLTLCSLMDKADFWAGSGSAAAVDCPRA